MGGRRSTWIGQAVGRHDGETKMGSTLMVKIGLNRESRDDLSGTFPFRGFVIVYLPFRRNLGNIQSTGNFLSLSLPLAKKIWFTQITVSN